MLGFIKKDLLTIKSNLKILLVIFVVFAIMAFNGDMSISFLPPYMSVMIMMSTFSYDAYNKWDSYASTLPNGRKNIVTSKYLSTIILILCTTFIVFILGILCSTLNNVKIDFLELFATIFATILCEAIMYPIIFKFGIEKARIGIFALIFGIILLGELLINYINVGKVLNSLSFFNNWWIIIFPLLVIIMLFSSYLISLKIYMKKEL